MAERSRVNPHAVPLRAAPDQPDALDPKRVALVAARWSAQDAACQGRDRMVEEHVRMLAGRQWDVWSDVTGTFVDPLVYLEPDERRWRQRPVIDYLGRGFQLAVAKLTESPPVIAFTPATSDREDAMLAETADTICKTVAQQADMDGIRPLYMGWAWVAGAAYLKSRVVYDGEEQPIVGPAVLPGPQGQEIVAPAVPYDAQGNPLAKLVGAMGGVEGEASDMAGAVSAIPEGAEVLDSDVPPDMAGAPVDAYGDVPSEYGYGDFGYEVTGAPATRRKARIVVDVLSPVEIRTEWRVAPIQEKRWVIHRTYLTRGEIEERYGVALDPDAVTTGKGAEGAGANTGGASASSVRGGGFLESLKLGVGHFGAVSQKLTGGNASGVAGAPEAGDGLLAVDEMWEKPCPEYEQGRLLVVLPALSRVLLDGPRPFQTVGAGPFREVACLEKPGRMFPSTPLEMAVSLQKALNRVAAQIMEHSNRCANPKLIVDPASGIEPADVTNKPGQILSASLAQGPAMAYVSPAPLGKEVFAMRDWLREELLSTLNIAGSEGSTPTADASGELVEQLRFNADRSISSIAHSAVRAEAGASEDWLAMLPTIWTDEEVIAAAGEDGTVRTVTVRPELFEQGRVNVVPVMESMMPESRGERQLRVLRDYQLGVFGEPGSPEANRQYLELMKYPHTNRSLEPGGVDRATAKRNLGRLVQGTPAAEIPLFQQYSYAAHLEVVREFIAAPEFVDFDPAIQHEVQLHFQLLQGAAVAAQMAAQQVAGAAQMALTVQAGAQAQLAAATHPAPAGPAGPQDGAPGASAGNTTPRTPAESGTENAPPSANGQPPFAVHPGAPA
jgi:hypothetical protein